MLKIAWSPLYRHPLPEGHRFPMEKYELIPEQLLYEGTIEAENLYEPELIDEDMILRAHTREYWHKLQHGLLSRREIRKTGFPFSAQLVQRGRTIAMGTLQNVRFAQQHGVALNGAGGTHHAFTDRGEGFCIFNDIAIAALHLLATAEIGKALVVDLDVHQGNGTAEILRGEERVFTFSMHCQANYPLKKEVSDLDIALPAYTGDREYLRILKETLPRLIQQVKPDVIFYLSGVDVLESDKLGKLSLSMSGCKERDAFVFQSCHEQGIPVAVSLGGGYSPRIRDIIEAHCNTFRLAREIWF
jgi:acetoin utilization deacetylase AcuC-like enzyme